MNTAAALKAYFNAVFPHLDQLKKGEDRLPGRELAEVVVAGLRKRGFQTTDVKCEEPFFTTVCSLGSFKYEILSYIYVPDEIDPIWAVECPSPVGFFARLSGKSDKHEHGTLLDALHDVLNDEPKIREIRWFKELPGAPFEEGKYGTSPREDA